MKEEFKQLSDREHLLLRPSMYIGPTSPEEHYRFVDGVYKSVVYTPALLKILNELIDNSIDEYLRSGKKYANKIKIVMEDGSFSISDNGRGIPVEKYEGRWRPEVAWCAARAGTSFGENRTTIGSHGIGSFATNVFSRRFIGTTYDGSNVCVVDCLDNCDIVNTLVKKSSKSTGTSVYCEPDFGRFGVVKFSEVDKVLIKSRLSTLALTYGDISFWFNDEKISVNYKEFLKSFGENFVCEKLDRGFLGVLPSQGEYVQYSSIDGLEMVQGGTHESYVSKMVANELRSVIKYKYRLDMNVSEIKSGMVLVMVGSEFPDMKFNSQTKEYLSNTESEVKKWLGEVDFGKIAKKLVEIEDFVGPIIANKLAKQRAIEMRELAKQQKMANSSFLKIDKYTPATGKDRDKNILFLSEGDCLHEDTEVLVMNKGVNGGVFSEKKMKDIEIGDLVLTHNHNIRAVYNKVKKVKEGIRVNGIICSPEHKLLVYDKVENKFGYVCAKDLDKDRYKLVKSNFFEVASGIEVIENIVEDSRDKYKFHISTSNNGYVECTGSHIFTRFNMDNCSIEKCMAEELKVGDLIVKQR